MAATVVATHERADAAERILRAAIALFRERGYHGSSMRTLARALRMEAASLYYHFASKQDILFAILEDRKSTRLNSSHSQISYAVFCLKKKKKTTYATECATYDRS